MKNILKNINKKYRISIVNPLNNYTVLQIFLTPMRILVFLFFAFLTFVAAAFYLVIFTPLIDTMPGFHGEESREILIKSTLKLDSLERELATWNSYRDNLIRVMDGRELQTIEPLGVADSASSSSAIEIVKASEIDSLFRMGMFGTQGDSASITNNNTLSTLELFTPVKGMVTKEYNIRDNFRGIEITSTGEEPVLAVNSGTVTLVQWSPEDGYILQIQHGNGMTTTYKLLSNVMKSSGESVIGGEVIGYIGDSVDILELSQDGSEVSSGDNISDEALQTLPRLILEFWSNGNSIDPRKYLIF